ncbi:Pancreatic triacylglycerol lipase [Frankliniella fusca]|uniref:Pancreatic triacylglycerol lipase n=1 Tax=Frankliniella fusca TaxID=407009 RepID=A0AAE1HPJ1_9NEOP|nr:Pancreatic triacylglycerol lipase [Frankliniella fusca]
MRFFLALAALCVAGAFAADSVLQGATKMAMKEVPAVPSESCDKNIDGSCKKLISTNLASNPGVVRPEILAAYDVNAELEEWMKQGYDSFFPVHDDSGKIVNASIKPTDIAFTTLAVSNKFKDNIKFHFFNKYDESDIRGYQISDANSLLSMGWDKELPVKVIIHGFTNTIESPAIQVLKNAFLKTGKYNIIGVDWGKLCAGINYLGARFNVNGAGAQVGEFLDKLIGLELTTPAQLHILGHSLGAHVAGIAGKSVTRGVVKRITGMDPAGPLFQLTGPNGIVFHTDAELVDIYHTNMHWLGKSAQLGDIDFYLNGGIHQPECAWKEVIVAGNGFGPCSHSRSFEYYAETLLRGYGLGATFCANLPGSPDRCLRSRADFSARSGHYVEFQRGGPYYLSTQWPKPSVLPASL